SGTGGSQARSRYATQAITSATSALIPTLRRHGHRCFRHSAGTSAMTASHALTMSAQRGGTPTSGSATSSAPKTHTKKKTPPTHGRGCTTARYHGSNVASSTSPNSTRKNTALRDVSVVLAQYAGSRKSRMPWQSDWIV